MIRLRFVEGGGWDSHIIEWDSRCSWSHVEAMLGASRTLGAQLIGGVKVRDIDDRIYRKTVRTKVYSIECDADAEEKFTKFMFSQNGKPYDWRAIISFELGVRDWREEDSWFCSELCSRGLELAGLLRLPNDLPVWRLTPRDLYMSLAMIPGCMA